MKQKIDARNGEVMSEVKKMILAAVSAALCVIIPQTFHIIPNAGSVFCPMHLPVLLCGLICGWQYGVLCGIVGPFLSFLLTGMPPAAMLLPMMVECATYGGVSGALMKVVRSGRIYVDLYVCLISAMLLGRIVAGVAKALIFARGAMTMQMWVTAHFVTSFPGIIVHLLLIPTIVYALMKAHLIPMRYGAVASLKGMAHKEKIAS